MSPDLVDQYKSSLGKLGVTFETDIKNCDVLITPKVARTQKFLYAIAKGIPVLSTEYLDWVVKNKKIPEHTNQFILRDPDSEKKYKFNMKLTIESAQSTPLFENTVFYMTPGTFPDNNTLKGLLFSYFLDF